MPFLYSLLLLIEIKNILSKKWKERIDLTQIFDVSDDHYSI